MKLSHEQVERAIVPLLETDALLTLIPWRQITERLNAALATAPPEQAAPRADSLEQPDHYDNVQSPISTTVGVIPCSTHTETAKQIPGMTAYIPEPQPQAASAGAPPNIQDLRSRTKVLLALLEDPQPGLASWRENYENAAANVLSFWGLRPNRFIVESRTK